MIPWHVSKTVKFYPNFYFANKRGLPIDSIKERPLSGSFQPMTERDPIFLATVSHVTTTLTHGMLWQKYGAYFVVYRMWLIQPDLSKGRKFTFYSIWGIYYSSVFTSSVLFSGLKPFRCSICGQGLSGRSALKNHLFAHTGEKPFQCGICKRLFAREYLGIDTLHEHVDIFGIF